MASFILVVGLLSALVAPLTPTHGPAASSRHAPVVRAPLRPTHGPEASSRHAPVVARLCTFNSACNIRSKPVPCAGGQAALQSWFESDEAIDVLLSGADRFERRTDGLFNVITVIPFPGMTAESVSVIRVTRLEAPSFFVETVDAETRCTEGPGWVRKLLTELLDATKSTSANTVVVELEDGQATFVSDVALKVEMTLPRWLLLPIKPMEESGSKSMQKVLDEQFAPVLDRFGEGFLAASLAKVD